jgi:hypothetical protein
VCNDAIDSQHLRWHMLSIMVRLYSTDTLAIPRWCRLSKWSWMDSPHLLIRGPDSALLPPALVWTGVYGYNTILMWLQTYMYAIYNMILCGLVHIQHISWLIVLVVDHIMQIEVGTMWTIKFGVSPEASYWTAWRYGWFGCWMDGRWSCSEVSCYGFLGALIDIARICN